LSDSLPADLGYLYENAVAQVIAASERSLYYHTWEKKNSSHYYEVDFLIASKTKIVPIEVKSSGIGKHESITEFQKKYSKHVSKEILLSQKDIGNSEMLKLYPIYMLPFLIEDL
jgi:predicted AAA+ superfamily ATPase